MKKAIVGILAVVAFAGGVWGGAALLPPGGDAAAPQAAERDTLLAPDSLIADSLLAPDAILAADSLGAADSLFAGYPADSVALPAPPATSTSGAPATRTPTAPPQAAAPSAPWPLATRNGPTAGARPPRLPITDLSATLAKLEDRELRPVLAQLDADVLDQIVVQASPRERTRLLAALPADRAARLVERLATGQVRRSDPPQRPAPARRPAATAAPPDSTAHAPPVP